MLDSQIFSDILGGEVVGTNAVSLRADLGVWIVAAGGDDRVDGSLVAKYALAQAEKAIEAGASLAGAISQANEDLKSATQRCGLVQFDPVSIMICRFDHEHYQLSWVGGSCSALLYEAQIDAVTQLSSELDAGVSLGVESLGRIPRVVGDIRSGDALLLGTSPINELLSGSDLLEVFKGIPSASDCGSRLAAALNESGVETQSSVAIIRYQEEESGYSRGDFLHRSPLDRSSYQVKAGSRPLFLALVLIAILIMVVVL